MNIEVKELIDKAKLVNDHKAMMSALTNLGLLIERHTQDRYADDSYHILFGNDDLFNLKLTNEDTNSIVHFLFYHIINIKIHPITVAWCLGKCYNYDIYDGIKRLLKLYSYDDDICEQLLFSLNALYDPRETFEDIAKILEEPIKSIPLPKTNEVLRENFEILNYDED
ncbi:hypothetical protein Q4Q34_05700 [Flavivirga abyssicola]|uniref:hypothetical protein n=1 Tax=Flavivirga abyssicola TaxID=3063533 RepID=UPI0026DEC96C|nr:hypothetical protein [Flavivirga sp. MEBiC07777]WVK14522.1 hypothetical protein Q4Q34_05700 [Flavivirga sp. MEBiC07777]